MNKLDMIIIALFVFSFSRVHGAREISYPYYIDGAHEDKTIGRREIYNQKIVDDALMNGVISTEFVKKYLPNFPSGEAKLVGVVWTNGYATCNEITYTPTPTGTRYAQNGFTLSATVGKDVGLNACKDLEIWRYEGQYFGLLCNRVDALTNGKRKKSLSFPNQCVFRPARATKIYWCFKRFKN